jgi:outer membrane protein insertion porin family
MMVMRAFSGRTLAFASAAALLAALPAMAQSAPEQGRRVRAESSRGVQINRVAFEGNSKLKGAQLEPEMQLKSRGMFDAATAQADVERIRAIYKRQGRGASAVSYRLVNLPNGRVDVVYTIAEGDKTGIRSIKFEGNNAYSDYRLRGVMQSTEMNFLSWFKSSDVYDVDRVASDVEAIRRYYTQRGYADMRIVDTRVNFVDGQGYDIVIAIDEGPRYRVGNIVVDSRLSGVDSATLQKRVRLSTGDVYNGVEMEKSMTDMARESARRGYSFAQVRPRGVRNPAAGTIDLALTVDDGPRVYVERINVRGNTRTRDYVIRREFDVGEGDPYNPLLLDAAERRLNNLGFFKKVRITNEPGSAPDRVIVNVDVEDQATGSFSVSGGYSTSDGLLAELSVTESNFLGRGQFVRAAVSAGQRSRGVEFSFTEPYFMDRRISAGFDLFNKQTDDTKYSRYTSWVTGGTVRFGIPITDELTFSTRYSLYQSKIKIPNSKDKPFDDCTPGREIPGVTPGTPGALPHGAVYNCLSNGEASLAIKEARGSRLVSMPGYSLTYSTIDNVKNPTSGFYLDFKQDIAGLGGDAKFLRTSGEARYYREITDDVVGFIKLQAGHIQGFGGEKLRMGDNYNLGPALVRGFAPNGIGPRDISNLADTRSNPLGGTTYFGGTAEVQFPIWGMPREIGLKGAVFADAGTLFGYKGETNYNKLLGLPAGTPCQATNLAPSYTLGNCITVWDEKKIRSSVGASLIWASPLGPIRFDWAYPITKGKYDVKQYFRFSGGTSF